MTRVSIWAAGPFLAACVLLVWSGWSKLRHPAPTRAAARAIGAPASDRAVRVLGAIEVAVAIVGTVIGSLGAVLVALVFTGLAFVAFRLATRAPATPCGCLGAADTPASAAHVIVNVACVVAAIGAALGASPFRALGTQPVAWVLFVALVGVAARLAVLTVEQLPALGRAAKGVRG